jgi:hypothetical protein
MTVGIWVCTRDPAVEILALPLHPCVILLALFAALTFEARGRHREQLLARALWRGLLATAILLDAFFFGASLLVRFLFGANGRRPSASTECESLPGSRVEKDESLCPVRTTRYLELNLELEMRPLRLLQSRAAEGSGAHVTPRDHQ